MFEIVSGEKPVSPLALCIRSAHPFDTMHGKYSAVTEAVVDVILSISYEGKPAIVHPVIAHTAVELETDAARILDVDCRMADTDIGLFLFVPGVEISEGKHGLRCKPLRFLAE